METPCLHLAGRRIGPGEPAFVIAELSANHHGRLEEALALVRLARAAGADAVKLQTYTADTMTLASAAPEFQIGRGTIWEGKNLHQLYQEAHTPWEWHQALFDEARAVGLLCFSSPFDATAVEFLEQFNPPAYKIASFELVDLALIRTVARTGRPAIMSTGMASLAEIHEAVEAFRGAGGRELALLKCTSAYPSPPEEMNLKTIPHLQEAFGVPVGLSDHTLGHAVAVAAVTLGAVIVEKHFTQSRSIPGPDSAFSLEPDEFSQLVQSIRIAEKAVGRVQYTVTEREQATRVFRRSLFVVADMRAGEPFTSANVRSIRPGHGLPVKHLEAVLGRRANRDIARGTPLSWDLLG